MEKTEGKIELRLGVKLSQIADIDERNQIMTTNVITHICTYHYVCFQISFFSLLVLGLGETCKLNKLYLYAITFMKLLQY